MINFDVVLEFHTNGNTLGLDGASYQAIDLSFKINAAIKILLLKIIVLMIAKLLLFV